MFSKLTTAEKWFFGLFLVLMVLTPIGYYFYDVSTEGSAPGVLLFALVMLIVWFAALLVTIRQKHADEFEQRRKDRRL
ncbi:hypothetical protein LJ737_04165 [Hymenobacter sp. 15J16-1T3B]|uniref:hypothetical protein n=1 Tax=Hymenobacter sp. 15J16-1T3B TaxID=2886941 RepID=UPI001D12D2CD|nr:hypothetical protein [Hymenobacter sp. 15J16-1T3B]MCC3156417.1 hypothetical protein [Hymenobacter sp. 15J16-1T3B]